MTGPEVLLVYAVRDEPEWLVADMIANVTPWVGHSIMIDNRGAAGGWQHEGDLRRRQLQEIRAWCAKLRRPGVWVLQLDPDERLERSAATVVPALLAELERDPKCHLFDVTLSFPLREMWTPTGFRTDGEWAAKKPRVRMFWFDMAGRQSFPRLHRPIHVGLMPTITRQGRRIKTDVRLYHLKSIEPLNRVKRAAAYLGADPTFQYQRAEGRDWTWLFDEDGLVVQEMEPGRDFTPPYVRPYSFTTPA